MLDTPAPGGCLPRANGLWVVPRHSAAGRNRKVLTLSSTFMPVFAGVMTSLCFLLTYGGNAGDVPGPAGVAEQRPKQRSLHAQESESEEVVR